MDRPFSYQVGGSLKATYEGYVPRPADTEIYHSLKNGDFCYVLTARQMGKSSLKVRTIKKLRKENWICVDLDITRFGSHNATAEQWYFSFLYEISAVLGFEDDFEDWWEKKQSFTPVARFSSFWSTLLCKWVPQQIAIFIDEIDSILSLDKALFSTDDFFAAVRAIYNEQTEVPDLQRIHFCLLGVASPDDLMEDPARTPFNIGKSIQLGNFNLEDTTPLLAGLNGLSADPKDILTEIMYWSGGQPYLTQKLCQAVSQGKEIINPHESVYNLVEGLFLSPGRLNDEANLSNVQRRTLNPASDQVGMLSTYGKIIKEGSVLLDMRQSEQVSLKLTGLVSETYGELRVNNLIYSKVFDQEWLDQIWDNLNRPFREQLQDWLHNNLNKDFLLRGEALRQAIAWSQRREDLTSEEQKYINVSRTAEEARLEKARRRLRRSVTLLAVLGIGLIYFFLDSKWTSFELSESLANIQREKRRADSLRIIAENEKNRASILLDKSDSLRVVSDSLYMAAQRNTQNLQRALGLIKESNLETQNALKELFRTNQSRLNELIGEAQHLIYVPKSANYSLILRNAAELLFIYTEAGKKSESFNLAQTVSPLLTIPVLPENWSDTLSYSQAVLEELLSLKQRDSLYSQYYPTMEGVVGGEFHMGNDKSAGNSPKPDESPSHLVKLSDFFIAKTEITQEQFRLFLLSQGPSRSQPNPILNGVTNLPAVKVSWFEAIQYCNWLSERENLEPAYKFNNTSILYIQGSKGYRLPTEAEWEYVAVGGQVATITEYAGGNNPNSVAWYADNSFFVEMPGMRQVALKSPNSLGIYDLSGNVWEWCGDWYDEKYYSVCEQNGEVSNPLGPTKGSYRVIRGGSWYGSTQNLRIRNRSFRDPELKSNYIGFRPVRTL